MFKMEDRTKNVTSHRTRITAKMTKRRRTFPDALPRGQALVVLACCAVVCGLQAEAAPVVSDANVTLYLSQFGYLTPADPGSERIIREEAISAAISEFQSFVGINVTGTMNDETWQQMTLPRCGVKDKVGRRPGGRSKRYDVEGFMWDTMNLTYKITKYSTKLDRDYVDEQIAKAFDLWTGYTDLSFSPGSGKVDIEIRFERGEHGDVKPFDGSSVGRLKNVLAHTLMANLSFDHQINVYFDDDEEWSTNSFRGLNFLAVATHEFGHALGLDHSSVQGSIMYPFYNTMSVAKLHDDDIAGIQSIYGPKTMVEAPQLCDDAHADAIVTSPEDDVYIFKGKYVWKLNRDLKFLPEYPKLIAEVWRGLPDEIDFVFVNRNGKMFFFKDSKYWSYLGKRMNAGYPRKITDIFVDRSFDVNELFSKIEDSKSNLSVQMKLICLLKTLIDIRGKFSTN